MTEFILKLFSKRIENKSQCVSREAYGRFACLVGIGSNAFMFALKLVVGILSSSIAVIADSVNNLSDALSSALSFVGFKLSAKPADEEHPYGHARIEYIIGLVISFIITILGFQTIKSSFGKILHPADTHFTTVGMILLVFAVILKLWQGLFYVKVAKKINSVSLRATSKDSLNDAVTTFAVLVSAIISKLTNLSLDGYFGLVVSVLIIISGIKLIVDTSTPLLGAAPDAELVNDIIRKITSYDGVLGYHDLVIHNYGPVKNFASVHVEVPAENDILSSHDLIDNIEFDVEEQLGVHLVIHLDPVVTADERVVSLKEEVRKIVSNIDENISFHDFRVVFGTTHSNILFDLSIPIAYKEKDEVLCHKISLKIKEINPTYNTVIKVDRNYTSTTNIN